MQNGFEIRLYKLIFLNGIFEFMINTAPPTFKQRSRHLGEVVKDLMSLMGDSERASSNTSKVMFLNFAHFFFLVF